MRNTIHARDLVVLAERLNRLIVASHEDNGDDITGLPKIKQAAPWTDANNVQRRAVAHVYRALKCAGRSPEEAALACGYARTTIDTWERVFV